MSMISFPFDSSISSYDENGYPIYDRASTSADFALLFSSFLKNGVFGAQMCEVLAGSGMTATVGLGKFLIDGRFGSVKDTVETVTFEAASSSYGRYDTVVLRRDLSTSVNNMVCAVVTGTPSRSPSAPALTRDASVWELGIANVYIPARSTAISQANITDTRLDNSRCGLVAAILTDLDTTSLYTQIQAELARFVAVQEADFAEWFATIQGTLEGDVAANLAGQVAEIQTQMDYKLSATHREAVLSAAAWSASAPYTQTVTLPGVTANSHLDVSCAPDSIEAYAKAFVRASAQGENTLTFTASKKPAVDLTAYVRVLEGVQ